MADTGGLREIVRHGENGATMYAGNPDSLTDQLRWLLQDPEKRRQMAQTAQNDVLHHYNWTALATQTIEEYRSLGVNRL
ncbi:glycosyltransferase, partial [Acinetobacter baumannii]